MRHPLPPKMDNSVEYNGKKHIPPASIINLKRLALSGMDQNFKVFIIMGAKYQLGNRKITTILPTLYAFWQCLKWFQRSAKLIIESLE